MVRTDCHTFDPLFSPLYISPKPLFLPKIVTQSPIFFTLSRILEIFHSKTPIRLEFEKKVPKCPLFFMAFVTERPPIFCLTYRPTWSVQGECCSFKHGQKLENFVFSKQSRAIWWIFLGANLIKAMKIKFQFYRLNRPNCALWMNFIGGQGWYTGYYHPSQTWKGIYPTTTLY